MKITSDDIYALLRQGEDISVEMKKCLDKLPRSVWETYSAFANSRGGVESTFGSKNHIEGQVNNSLGQEKGQENRNKGQENKNLGQVNSEEGQENEIFGKVNQQENLSDKQKEILLYLLKHPSESLKNCSAATGASAKSIRYTFKKVSGWLDIRHKGPDKTGIWSFKLLGNE